MKEARANWERALLVCGRCSRKLGGGFGPKGERPLAKALREELGVKKGRKARIGVVEVKCLGVCPKGAVTLVDSVDPHRWRLVSKGEDVAEVARHVLGVMPAPRPDRPRVVATVEHAGTLFAVAASDQPSAA